MSRDPAKIRKTRRYSKGSRKSPGIQIPASVLYAAVPDGIVTADMKTRRIISVNPGACRLFGYSSKEFLTKRVLQLHPTSEIQKVFAHFRELARGKKTLASDIPCIKKNGTVFFVDIAARLFVLGKRQCLVGLFRDITGRRQREEALREGEEKLRLFVEHAPAAIAMLDNNMNYITASRRWFTDYGLKDRKIIGRSHYEVFPEIPERWKRIHRRCLKGAVEKNESDPFVRADGHTDWISWEVRPWKKNEGTIGGLIMFTEIITGRKRAEEEIKKSLSLERATLESTADGILVVDHNTGKVADFNDRFARLWRIPKKILESHDDRKLLAHVLPQLRNSKRFLSKVKELYRHPSKNSFDVLEFKDGRVFERYSRPQLVDGKPVGRVWSFRDVTEQKRAEEVLENNQALLEATGQMAKVGGWEFDIRTRKLVWTKEVYRIHEVDADYQPTVEKAIAFYAPASRPLIERAVQRAVDRGKAFDLELEIITAQGKHRCVHAMGNVDQGCGRVFGTFQDVTERKRAEDSLREHRRQLLQIIDTVPHMIFAKDRQGRFLLANRAVEMMYGREPQQLIGKKCQDIHPVPEEAKKFTEADRQVLDAGKPVLVPNEAFTDVRGRKHILQTVKIPFDMAGLKEKAILGVSVDVTEQRKVEEFRNDIVRTVSHELRTPLSIQKEGVNLVLDGTLGPINPEQEMILRTVMRSVNRLSRMIGGLLDISRFETGKSELRKEKTVLEDLLKDVVFEFRKKFEEKGLEIKLTLPGSETEVLVDPDKITQVLTNLVENAFKFTEKGVVEISRVVLKDEVECAVRDTGIGIAPGNVDKIFEKFQQFSRTAGPGEKGLGLGLAISREIIGMHEGRIWAKSELGKGTRIMFTLPLCGLGSSQNAVKGAEFRRSAGRSLFSKKGAS